MKMFFKTCVQFCSWYFDEPMSNHAVEYYLAYKPNGEGAFIVRPSKNGNFYCLSYKTWNKDSNEWQYQHLNLEIGVENKYISFEGEEPR